MKSLVPTLAALLIPLAAAARPQPVAHVVPVAAASPSPGEAKETLAQAQQNEAKLRADVALMQSLIDTLKAQRDAANDQLAIADAKLVFARRAPVPAEPSAATAPQR